MLGAFGKSAQIGLHVWLPEAMEGPTPVSALIHAATMVTAGVFLVIRFSILFEFCPSILKIILLIGSFTALLSSLIGSFQYDIKKIVAYSTCSQLGYMFVSCGFSNYNLTLFHLFNHAFFKALLFLSSGLVIHCLHTQDIRHMDKKKEINLLIIIFFLIPSLSLCGLPFFSGAFSKEQILSLSTNLYILNGEIIYLMIMLGAFFTLFYSIKLLFFIYAKNRIYTPYFSIKKRIEYYNLKNLEIKHFIVYKPLILLLFLSITSGYIFHDVFLGINSDFFIKDIYINNIQKKRFIENDFEVFFFFTKYFPFLLSIFSFFIFENLNYLIKNNLKIYYFFKNKLYFDFIYNILMLNLKKN
jgi:NADH:ubiquinone oxidoreductase subunit 5 (subunit L)/multisubunit Na+/H+ antiporter MnhA subunit